MKIFVEINKKNDKIKSKTEGLKND